MADILNGTVPNAVGSAIPNMNGGDIISLLTNGGVQIAMFAVLAVIIGVGFAFFGGFDRWRNKVPLFKRASEESLIFFEDDKGIGREWHKAILWNDNTTGATMLYFPKLKYLPMVAGAEILTNKPIKLFDFGGMLIPFRGVNYSVDEVNMKEGEGNAEITKKKVERKVLFNIEFPELLRIKEDLQLQLGIQAELLRPKENPYLKIAEYVIFGLLIVALMFVAWFSAQQSQAALNQAPAMVEKAANICKDLVINSTRNY